MNYVIVYWSRYGNGKKIVYYITTKLKDKGVKTQVFKTDETDPASLPDADVYIFSAPAEAFNLQKNMRTFMKNLEGMEEKKFGIINTHGMKSGKLEKIEKILSSKKMVMVAGVDFQVGKEAQSGNALPDGWELKIDDFIEKL